MAPSRPPHLGWKAGLFFTNNNIWKMFLLFVVAAFFNISYITQHVLTPEEANLRLDQRLLASFAIGGPNSTWIDAFDEDNDNHNEAVEDNVAVEENVVIVNTKITKKEAENLEAITNTDTQNLVKTYSQPGQEFVKTHSMAIDWKAAKETDNVVKIAKEQTKKITNTDAQQQQNIVKTYAQAGQEFIKTGSVATAVKKNDKVEQDENDDEEDNESDAEDEDDSDAEDENDSDAEDEDDNDAEEETDDNAPEDGVIPVNMTNSENNSILNTAMNSTDNTQEDVEIIYRPRIGKRKKKKKKKKLQTKKRRRRKHRTKKKTYSPEQIAKWKPKETAVAPNISNAEYYKDIPAEFLVEDPTLYLWDRPELMIPEWMKDYFRWHRWKRSTWKDMDIQPHIKNSNNTELEWWEKERWLISQCLMDMDKKKCGGTADRLKPIPVLIRVAYENKRVFLIRWTRPAPLEEFLMPPVGGFDWRLPPELYDVMDDFSIGKRLPTRKLILDYAARGLSLCRARYQTGTPASSYNELVFTGPNAEVKDIENFGFDSIFSRVWKVLFTPTPPIQAIIQSKLSILGLVPNEYVAAHLRALYATNDRPPQEIKRFTENALACATTIYPGVPIFFASDSTISLEYAHGFTGRKVVDPKNQSIMLNVITAADVPTPSKNKGNHTQPWHLDSYIGPVENFYDTFVDLYMLAMGGCVTFGKGGYGNWASLIGGHVQCQKMQYLIGKRVKHPEVDYCKWNAATESYESILKNFHTKFPSVFGRGDSESEPIFLPPMGD